MFTWVSAITAYLDDVGQEFHKNKSPHSNITIGVEWDIWQHH